MINKATTTVNKNKHMHINQLLKESKFLKKEDCNPPILVTIKNLTQENMALEGDPLEMKWVIHFNEVAKPMGLNSTNAQLIAQIVKSEETDNWPGHKIVLYNDPSVCYGGKLIGGIRARAPRNQPAPAPKPAPAAQPVADGDDCPF